MKVKKNPLVQFALCGILLCSLALGGCGRMDELVEQKEVDVSKPVKTEKVESGVYILTSNDEFYKANTLYQSFSGETTMVSNDRYIYSVDGGKFIPTLYSDDKLIYVSDTSIPDEVNVEQFKTLGFTVGAVSISKGTNGSYSVTLENILKESDLYKQISDEMGNAKALTIKNISGNALKKERITSTGTITNLSENEAVTIDAYVGTFYKEIQTKADTKVWVSSRLFSIDDISLTKNGYAILNYNFSEGYYDLNNEGLIRVVNEKRP